MTPNHLLPRHDWKALREEFSGGFGGAWDSLRSFAKAKGISVGQVLKRANAEGWLDDIRAKNDTKIKDKARAHLLKLAGFLEKTENLMGKTIAILEAKVRSGKALEPVDIKRLVDAQVQIHGAMRLSTGNPTSIQGGNAPVQFVFVEQNLVESRGSIGGGQDDSFDTPFVADEGDEIPGEIQGGERRAQDTENGLVPVVADRGNIQMPSGGGRVVSGSDIPTGEDGSVAKAEGETAEVDGGKRQ